MIKYIQTGQFGRTVLRSSSIVPTVLLDSQMLVSCDTVITLTAELIGGTGTHAPEWQQISGTPVIWLEDLDQVSVTFQQPPILDDKVFRFYLNRGTTKEIYKDILVTAVPRESLIHNGALPTTTLKNYTAQEMSFDVAVVPGFSAYDSTTIDNNDLVLLWRNPYYYYVWRDSTFVMQRQNNGDFAEIPVGNDGFYLGAMPNISYRVEVIVDPYDIRTRIASSSASYVPDPSVRNIDASDQALAISSMGSSISVLEVLQRELAGLDGGEDNFIINHNHTTTGTMRILEVLERQLTSLTPEEGSLTNGLLTDVFVLNSNHTTVGSMRILEVKTIGITSLG